MSLPATITTARPSEAATDEPRKLEGIKKTFHSLLPDIPECVEIIREVAIKVENDKDMKTRLKAQYINYTRNGTGR